METRSLFHRFSIVATLLVLLLHLSITPRSLAEGQPGAVPAKSQHNWTEFDEPPTGGPASSRAGSLSRKVYHTYLPMVSFAGGPYYVAPNGDDANPGTKARPWRTVGRAAAAVKAGGTVTFRPGIYDLSAEQTWPSGRPDRWVTFRGEGDVVWRHAEWQATSSDPLVDLNSVSYIKFEGIKFKGLLTTDWALVYIGYSDHIIFDACEVYNTSSRGICIRSSSDVTIQNCMIHNDIGDSAANALDGIAIGEAGSTNRNILIDNCEIYHTPHLGIGINRVDGITVQNCTIHDTDSHGIGILDSTDITNVMIGNNTFYRLGFYDPKLSESARALYIVYGSDITIYRNTIYENKGPGISIDDTAVGPIDVYNNTLYNNDQHGVDWGDLFLHDAGGGRDPIIRIKNNIVSHTQAGTYTYDWENAPFTHVDADHNLLYDSTGTDDIQRGGAQYRTYAAYQAAGHEPNTIVSQDPLFNNAVGADFTLQAGSPAIDAGVDLGYSYQGNAPDIGAQEYPSDGG